MNILITGATGRIGSALAKRLIGRGEHVRGLVLPDDPNADKAKGLGLECVTGSLTDYDAVLAAVEGVDAVFHLGAVMLFDETKPETRPKTWDVNIQGTYHVFEAAAQRANRPLRLIYASSDEVYPAIGPRYQPTDETHPRFPYSFYGLGKVLGEEMIRFYGRNQSDVEISIARFTLTQAAEEIVDPNGLVAPLLFFVNGRLGALKGSGSTDPKVLETIKTLEPLAAPDEPLLLPYDLEGNPFYQEATDARDIAQGLELMLDRPEAIGEVFNLTPPTIVSMAEFIPYMAEATGRRYVEAKLAFGWRKIHGSGAKARALLGYNPQYTLFDMVDEAVGRK
jgi:UDP-glucose 4-epimerase